METVELADGRRASYEVVGRGEPLLLFVGGPGFAASFVRPDAELLADRFASYLIDPHGSGASSPPADAADYDHLGHARFYDEARRALGLGRVSVGGVSFGGTVALTYAALFPEVVVRCIAVSAFVAGTEIDAVEGAGASAEMERLLLRHSAAPWYPAARAIWDDWTERVLAADDPEQVAAMFRTILPLYFGHPDRPEVRARIEAAAGSTAIDLPAAKAWEAGLYQTIDLRPVLGRIAAPTLVVAGELDPIGGPAQARRIASAVRSAVPTPIPDCGHLPAWEAPDAYRAAIETWVGPRPRDEWGDLGGVADDATRAVLRRLDEEEIRDGWGPW